MSTITPQILLKAYAAGIFPMAESAEDNALYWVEPEERGIIPLDGLHISRSLRKRVRQRRFTSASTPRSPTSSRPAPPRRMTARRPGSTSASARSMASFQDGLLPLGRMLAGRELVGGLYGVRIGAAFFGESMFSRETDASKVALVHLVARLNAGGFSLLDAQFTTPHLESLGAGTSSRADYHALLERAIEKDADFFRFDGDGDPELVLRLADSPTKQPGL